MREIKFRAWLDGEMYPDVSTWTDDYTEMLNDTLRHFQEREDERMILMQYTGLKDKNGKEIYEGDIIKVSSSSPNLELIEEVKWISDGDWMADKQPLVGFIHHSSIYKKPIEIIGNIYENPELLTN